ncbi:MAG: hypothetical protein LBC73_00520 [Oscillospiraceae bacterium]|jgi:hypothetical protein|nr:hypothetical protein [Oscillospiraceae bacterium]
MKIDNSIIDLYIKGEPSSMYSNHWVYSAIIPEQYCFTEPDVNRILKVETYRDQITNMCHDFTFRNNDLVHKIFDNTSTIVQNANILFTVGLPEMYDAMVREHNGRTYIIIDLINFSNYLNKDNSFSDITNNFLTHELIHVLINEKYPKEDFDYIEYLDYTSFHEGFAHLLSYKDNIMQYQLDDTYKERFINAKDTLIAALNETDPMLRQRYTNEANSGKYWNKFAAISSMLYLMKHREDLKSIYEKGWRGFTQDVINS